MTNSISVSWNPPSNQNVMVRGYTIGWGKGIPDVYSKLVDGKQRAFVIEKLEANSEYVISLRAYNQMGDGRPIYETVRTREESTPEPPSPLIPPVGLKAIVLSSTTVVLYWTDTTLPRSQVKNITLKIKMKLSSIHSSWFRKGKELAVVCISEFCNRNFSHSHSFFFRLSPIRDTTSWGTLRATRRAIPATVTWTLQCSIACWTIWNPTLNLNSQLKSSR